MPSFLRRIISIDCQYLRPKFAAAYLLTDTGRAAFIDNNTAHSVPLLLEALKTEGLTPEHVDWIIVTHIHLDHAGGTSQLMKLCPNAKCLAHPRAAKHLIDPSKLVQSARQVYGDEAFEAMYGTIEAIPAERVQVMEDASSLPFGSGQPLQFIHTRGHANHHMCIYEPDTRSIFTGDSFGLAYPVLQRAGLFIFPSTSPTDFDYDEAVASLDKIVASGATTAYLTHFGAVTELDQARRELRGHLSFSRALLKRADQISDELLTPTFEKELKSNIEKTAAAQGLRLTPDDRALLSMDLELNAQGLTAALLRARKSSS